ncbi:MAG: tetratricopeptide repeat protein [Deltaproteobacteria bacterium]|nr:tetratricopeptide repeat protein [Deltaproteobacteria bacterium]
MRRIVIAVLVAFWVSAALPVLTPDASAYGLGTKDKKKKKKPTLEYERFRRAREVDVQMQEKRKVIRDQLEQLIKYEKDKKELPALLFRLGENYFEEATSYFNRAQKLDNDLAKDPENNRLRKEIERKQKSLKVVEIKWRQKAIDLYKKIANTYTSFPGRDQVLFYLAYSLWDIEKYKEALTTYRQMIKAYRNSKYVPDAYLAFGEYYFDQAKLDKALMAYKKVAEFKESPVYPYSLYKQGWCYFNLHEWSKAKDMFQSVVYLADIEKGTTGKKRIEVRKEALQDFTLTYSHEGSATAAPRVFKRLAPKEGNDMLISLAGMYFGDGQDKKAILLYTYLIKQAKCSAEVPFYQGRVVDCGSRVGNYRYTIQQVRKLVELFKDVSKCLKNPNPREKERLKEARELAEVTLRRLSSTWYKEAKETKQKETFSYAQEMFGDYLELFPNSPDAYDMRFAYAELLFHRLGRYERAASEYAKVVSKDLTWLKKHKRFPKKGTKNKKGQSAPGTYLCDAAYKGVLAHREIMKKERKKERKRERKRRKKEKKEGKQKKSSLKKKVIPKGKKRFIKAAEIYLDHCPKDQDICSVKFDIAKTYYDYSHFNEAVKRFDEVVKDCTGEDLAEYAANLVLDTYNLRQDWDKLNKYARKYYANPTLMKNDKLKTFLNKLIPQIAFKRITMMITKLPKEMAVTRKHYKVGRAYIKFVREFSKHDMADEALFNSSVEFEQAERLDLAKKARNKLINEYPTSDLVPGTIFNLAENFERMTDFDSAAALYEKYAKTYKRMKGLGKAVSYKGKRGKKSRMKKRKRIAKKKGKAEKEKRFKGNRRTWNSEDAQAALMNAGIYREALHQFKEAIRDRLEFVKLFPRSEDAAKVYYSLGLLYEKMGRAKKAAAVFKRYSGDYFKANIDRAVAAHMKRAEMLMKIKKWREAEKEMHTVVSLYRKYKRKRKELLESAEAAAHAKFILGEKTYKDYIKFRFTQIKAKKLKRQLDKKGKLLKKVTRVYTDIAKLKQPEWAIASLYKLGRAYENFAGTFYKAPLPKGLTPEQRDTYTQMLREKGQPWEDKAVAHFKAAVDKGSELGFYSKFTVRSLKKLQHYRPGDYPREDLGFRLSVVADSANRHPLLLATWEEVKKKPDLLKEPPLQTQRKGGLVPVPKAPPDASEPKEEKTKEPKAEKPKAEAKKEAPKNEMPADPASEAMNEDEPEDEFE